MEPKSPLRYSPPRTADRQPAKGAQAEFEMEAETPTPISGARRFPDCHRGGRLGEIARSHNCIQGTMSRLTT